MQSSDIRADSFYDAILIDFERILIRKKRINSFADFWAAIKYELKEKINNTLNNSKTRWNEKIKKFFLIWFEKEIIIYDYILNW